MMNFPNIHSRRMLSFFLSECFMFMSGFFYCQPIQVLLLSICINVIGVTSKCLIKYYVKSFYCLSLHKRYNKIERANQTLFRRYFTFKVSNMLVCFPPALALNVIRPVASYEVKTSVNLSCSTIICVLWE